MQCLPLTSHILINGLPACQFLKSLFVCLFGVVAVLFVLLAYIRGGPNWNDVITRVHVEAPRKSYLSYGKLTNILVQVITKLLFYRRCATGKATTRLAVPMASQYHVIPWYQRYRDAWYRDTCRDTLTSDTMILAVIHWYHGKHGNSRPCAVHQSLRQSRHRGALEAWFSSHCKFRVRSIKTKRKNRRWQPCL